MSSQLHWTFRTFTSLFFLRLSPSASSSGSPLSCGRILVQRIYISPNKPFPPHIFARDNHIFFPTQPQISILTTKMANYYSRSGSQYGTVIAQPQNIHNFYSHHQISPANSQSSTPMNISPTSPRNPSVLSNLPHVTRQLRPPKSPMYIPAVLRPTERPHRQSPLTPPRSLHGSTDSLDKTHGGHHSKPPSRPGTRDELRRHSSMGSTGSIRMIELVSERFSPDLGQVTGPPSRAHWKLDENADICDAPECQKFFNFFERRHHCRKCGHVFCNTHSPYTVPLDQAADFHPEGEQSRACRFCWNAYTRWEEEREIQLESWRVHPEEEETIKEAKGMVIGKARETTEEDKSVASSVPRDWTWSSF